MACVVILQLLLAYCLEKYPRGNLLYLKRDLTVKCGEERRKMANY